MGWSALAWGCQMLPGILCSNCSQQVCFSVYHVCHLHTALRPVRAAVLLAAQNVGQICGSTKQSPGRDISAILLNITALLLRLAQTITKIYRNKIAWFLFPRKKIVILFYLHALQYVVPVLLYCTKLGDFFLQLTKGAVFSGWRYHKTIGQGCQTLIDYLSQK